LGITISKRIGKAVVRNKLKRRIKAFFRDPDRAFPKGVRINLIAKVGCAELTYQSLCMELEQILNMTGTK
ncbi:MAG: ribonuclease P protein component, partial [Candidatus Cloacimonadaceae bacterium]|nr:ribonuclease P protein component [Candidatus Cloacimonadaceae bacterium]